MGSPFFLAIIYLSLIVFSCSIVEVTRLNISKVQAERAMLSASQSVLSGYDFYLKDNFGIFARSTDYGDVHYLNGATATDTKDLLTQDFEYYVKSHLNNNPDDIRQSYVDATFFDKSDRSYWQLTKVNLNQVFMTYPKRLIDKDGGDISYIKEDMLKFMDLRVPMLLLQPLLEKFDAFEKVGKTGQFIKEKNEVVSSAAEVEEMFLDLYKYVEGITIDEGSGAISLSGESYVKRLTTSNLSSSDLYMASYVESGKSVDTSGAIVQKLANERVDMDSHISAYVSNVENYETYIVGIKANYDTYEELEIKIKEYQERLESHSKDKEDLNDTVSEINEDIEDLEKDSEKNAEAIAGKKLVRNEIAEKLRSIERDIDMIRDKMNPLLAEQRSALEALMVYRDMADRAFADSINRIIHIETLTIGDDSYLAKNKKVIEVIDAISAETQALGQQIDGFIASHEGQRSQLIDSSYVQTLEELQTVKDSYVVTDDDPNMNPYNNLPFMRLLAEENVGILEGHVGMVEAMVSNHDSVIGQSMTTAGLTTSDIDEIESIIGASTGGSIFGVSPAINTLDVDKYVDEMNAIGISLNNYRREMLFDYSQFDGFGSDVQSESQGLIDKLKAIVSGIDLSSIYDYGSVSTIELLDNHPSIAFGTAEVDGLGGADSESAPNLDYEESGGEDQYFNDTEAMSGITQVTRDFRELIFLNEYAVGMFSAYPDMKDDEALTLTGQKKSEHAWNTEVEYILTGNTDPEKALSEVIYMIFGMRVVCNIIHLMTDAAKRTAIMNIANAVAGWWSFGLAAIIVGVLLTLLWASAESMVDIMMLINNKKVPLIKMKNTWFTAVDGDKEALIGFVAEAAEDVALNAIDVLSSEVSDTVTEVAGLMSDEVKGFYELTLGDMYEDGKLVMDAKVQEVGNQYYTAIDDYLLACKEGRQSSFGVGDYFTVGDDRDLLSEIIVSLDTYLGGHFEQSHLIMARMEVTKDYEDRIDKRQTAILGDMELNLDKQIQEAATNINTEIEKLKESGKEVTKEAIKKQAAMELDKLKNDRAAGLTGKEAEGKKSIDLIPRLSYNDYIRLFMLIDYNGIDKRVHRMLDVIELNLAIAKGSKDSNGDYDTRLEDYVIGVSAYGNYEMEIGMFLMPFMKYRDQSGDGMFKFTTRAVNNYE